MEIMPDLARPQPDQKTGIPYSSSNALGFKDKLWLVLDFPVVVQQADTKSSAKKARVIFMVYVCLFDWH